MRTLRYFKFCNKEVVWERIYHPITDYGTNNSTISGRIDWGIGQEYKNQNSQMLWMMQLWTLKSISADLRKRKDFGRKHAVTNELRTTIGQFVLFGKLQNGFQSKITFVLIKMNGQSSRIFRSDLLFAKKKKLDYETQKNCVLFLFSLVARTLYCSSWRPRFIHSWKDTVQLFLRTRTSSCQI